MAKKEQSIQYYQGIGRRKEAVARVRLYIPGKDKTVSVRGKKLSQGSIVINEQPVEAFFTSIVDRKRLVLPLELTNNADRFVVSISVKGGGHNGQVEAIMHGVSRALKVVNGDEYRPLLRENDLLTRDPRTRERRKVGTGGKARRAKQSPKR